MVAYGYNVLLINSRFERAFDEGRVILLPDSDDRPITNKPVGYIKTWKIVVLDCHDLQRQTYAIPERRPPRSALPLLSVSILIPP
jgi:hypothetical protein